MIHVSPKARIEYGDFQTPPELAERVCHKLVELGVQPDVVIEPTCGVGAFIEAAAKILSAGKIIGVEINPDSLAELQERLLALPDRARVETRLGDFFRYDWESLLAATPGRILILGNFPWVTSAQQGSIGGVNLPKKQNFQNHSGWEALTGKSNFDISEWMLIQSALWLRRRGGEIAMLCKTGVARKFLGHLQANHLGLAQAALYRIDAFKYFSVSVDACLLYCQLEPEAQNYDYQVFTDLDAPGFHKVGYRHGLVVRDVDTFDKLDYLCGKSDFQWRSGIKHDCAEVMELRKVGDGYVNGVGETVDVEPAYLFPLLKGSDVANDRLRSTTRYALVPQRYVGEPTSGMKAQAPKVWAYLEAHASRLDQRKSRIYQGSPRFSIFGVGPYTFAPWKIAVCSLYKALDFRLIGEIEQRPVVFDDTVYFLGFESESEAKHVFKWLTSMPVLQFLSSLIFWDDKRPIKTSILNCLKIPGSEMSPQLTLFPIMQDSAHV